MKVDDLQDMLALIRQLLASAGGKGTAELADFGAALDPFRDMTVKQLTGELRKLTERPAPPKGKKSKTTSAEADALITEIAVLYNRAGDSATTSAEVEQKTEALHGLGKPDIIRAAESIGLKGMKSKSKPAIVSEIKKRIGGRVGAGQRTGMIDIGVGSEGE
jgi:hypothetical protein